MAVSPVWSSTSEREAVPADITCDSMRTAFAAFAADHEAGSIRRCWSTWNVLCTNLYTNFWSRAADRQSRCRRGSTTTSRRSSPAATDLSPVMVTSSPDSS